MFEKVNKYHPDKIADRIAGALVDYAYTLDKNPKIAVEVLIGHRQCFIVIETDLPSDYFNLKVITPIVTRIADYYGEHIATTVVCQPQDKHLSDNQKDLHCGDNGIFCGMPVNKEEKDLKDLAIIFDKVFSSDGKYIYDADNETLIVCQSNASAEIIRDNIYYELGELGMYNYRLIINPLGYWTGGIDVDTGATNRKLGSDMGRAATGGGLHGKDLSKADVSVNIFCHLLAGKIDEKVEAFCSIGSDTVRVKIKDKYNDIPFKDIVATARTYIDNIGGFEKFAEYGLIR